MPRQRHIKPLDRVVTARSRIDTALQVPESVKTNEELWELLKEASYVIRILSDVRNIVRAVSDLDQEPSEAVELFIANEAIHQA